MSSHDPRSSMPGGDGRSARHRIDWILVIPFIAMLVPQLFDYREPSLGGMPFFYWYLLVWIPLTSLLTWIVYRAHHSDDSETPPKE